MLKLLIFVGTAREKSKTRKVVDFLMSLISEKYKFEVKVVDPREMNLSLNDEAQDSKFPELKKVVSEADAYIIVAPEYNHGYSAGIKFILDLNLKEYLHKPVSLVGVSNGPFGGARAVQQLVTVTRRLGMVPTRFDFLVSDVNSMFTESGEVEDREKWVKRAIPMLDELDWMAKSLMKARESSE